MLSNTSVPIQNKTALHVKLGSPTNLLHSEKVVRDVYVEVARHFLDRK